ncbi:hypothetical protein PR048_007209 [Dryococelus australis]|uniref:Uncharacterized protein n=1 Tax=Dryococelus australis TaxID=614101 RepID=A0ABQ9ID10_9NEOP|nr:hypothetical protein PR048_007209 [Dryococelus australis]
MGRCSGSCLQPSCFRDVTAEGAAVAPTHHRPIGPYHTGPLPVLYSVHYWPIINQWIAELDKIYFKRVYTEVTYAIGSEFIRHALDDSVPIADLQGNKKRILCCQMWVAPPPLLGPGAAVTERLDRSPPTMANQVQSPARSQVGIAPDDAADQRVFLSEIFRFPRTCIPVLLHSHLISPLSALKTSLLRAAQISRHPVERNGETVLKHTEAKQPLPPRTPTAHTSKLASHGALFANHSLVTHVVANQTQGSFSKPRTGNQRTSTPTSKETPHNFDSGATVAERLNCLPPPPHQGELGSMLGRSTPDFCELESCRTMPVVGGFSRGYPVSLAPFIPGLLHTHLTSPASALKTSLLRLSTSVQRQNRLSTSELTLGLQVFTSTTAGLRRARDPGRLLLPGLLCGVIPGEEPEESDNIHEAELAPAEPRVLVAPHLSLALCLHTNHVGAEPVLPDCEWPSRKGNGFSSRQQPMAIDKLLLVSYSIEVYRVLVFYRKKSPSLPVVVSNVSYQYGPRWCREWLVYSPPTKVNRVQSPAGSPDFRKWESCRTMPLVGRFPWGFPLPPPPPTNIPALLHTHLTSPSLALSTSMLTAVHISPLHSTPASIL